MTSGQSPRVSRPLGIVAADTLLLTAALIWGVTFVAQKLATEHMGPLLFTGIRFAIGAAILLPIALPRFNRIASRRARRSALFGGCLAGIAMALGSTLQQVGMHSTSVSNAGFITGLYVIIVPMLGLFVGQRVRWNVWVGAALAVAGLFYLSIYDPSGSITGISINQGDVWVLACAVAWGFHVQIIGWAAPDIDPFVISAVQFAVTGAAALVASQVVAYGWPTETWGAREVFSIGALQAATWPLAFAAVLSTCIAFTLQTVAQGSAPPAHAAILLSLESVFAALAEAACLVAGWTNLGSPMTRWKLFGCALIFAGVILSQWRIRARMATA